MEDIELPKKKVESLPEKWKIERTVENYKSINEWARQNSNEVFINDANWVYFNGKKASTNMFDGCTEITFEQFKKYVLKEGEIEKKIIGYKAPVEFYAGRVKKDTLFETHNTNPTIKNTSYGYPQGDKIGDRIVPIELVESWEAVYEVDSNTVLLSSDLKVIVNKDGIVETIYKNETNKTSIDFIKECIPVVSRQVISLYPVKLVDYSIHIGCDQGPDITKDAIDLIIKVYEDLQK